MKAVAPFSLISNMAMHTKNLRADPRASLFVGQDLAGTDPLGAARVTLLGQVEVVPEAEIASVRECYLGRHPNSSYWVDFADFHFFRLEPVEAYYVGGFGVMGWVDADAYGVALPDPLASSASWHPLAHERGSCGFHDPACTQICSNGVDRSRDDGGRPPWFFIFA